MTSKPIGNPRRIAAEHEAAYGSVWALRPWRAGRSLTLSADALRALGQVRRGEVLVGLEGARRIAARHEEAYGDVWARRLAEPGADPHGSENAPAPRAEPRGRHRRAA